MRFRDDYTDYDARPADTLDDRDPAPDHCWRCGGFLRPTESILHSQMCRCDEGGHEH